MSRIRRLLLGSLISLMLLFGGILIWSMVFFDPNDYREGIAERIEEETGLTFTLEGPLRLDFRFHPGVGLFADLALEDAYLRKIVGLPGSQNARIRELTLSLPVVQLFRFVRGERFEGSGRFSVTDLDLVPILAGFDFDGQPADRLDFRAMTVQGRFQSGLMFFSITDLAVAGSSTEVSGDLRFADKDQDTEIEFALLSPSLNLDEMVSEQSRGPLDAFEWLSLSPLIATGLRARGVLQIGTFQSGGVLVRNLKIPINSEGGAVVASPVTADLYGGTMRIDTVTQVVGRELNFMTRQTFSQVDMGQIIWDMGLTRMLRGKANLEAIVAFSGAEYLERVRSARGVVTLEAETGQIKGVDLASALGQLTGNGSLRGGNWLGENAYTALENVTATLTLENSKLANQDLAFRAGGFEVAGEGNLGLESEQLDYRVSLALDRPELFSQLPSPFNSAGLALPLRVTGRWDNPEIMIDMPVLIQMQLQRAMGIESNLAPPSPDTHAEALAEALETELSGRLNQLSAVEVAQ
ncbi:MAG TPA: hypothetical protein DHW07_08230 [Gammaproteobacteria bacterium]|nr:hypothetical protein [Gammaproteobacteria bacterium]